MSDPAAPWWADVQHLRPREDRMRETFPPRFDRDEAPVRETREASLATLEHDVPAAAAAPAWQAEDAAWLETLSVASTGDEPSVWDPSLEESFARTPSWADEDDERLLPKGANRIENGRRTIEIRGQVDRVAGLPAPAETRVATRTGRRRPAPSPAERLAGRPDRVAMWAFLLGILLILIAALSSPGDAGAAAALY